ncbi:hypothetical protein N7520_003507 [Penicillium odoratum]|uniref:uncharacterized protein n=1 Tax=Penicillium odoratum TaxID=1167516 RepID=UPI002547F6D9|nr:uncharacterized protein N7520_003507 [Penicillium odoratum]KAJ5768948.1 hypothetical protein N7520_003507 [Penicillium odoratum]
MTNRGLLSSNLPIQTYLFSHLGLQSNVIVAASYTSAQGTEVLSRDILYPAIRHVVQLYPELSTVTFSRPSTTMKNRNRRWSGFLRQIDLDNHVKFVHISEKEEKTGLSATIQRYHNIWFEDVSEKPPWQLIVVNGKHVLFVFDHYFTDGRGAAYILGGLLKALNQPSKTIVDDSPIVKVAPELPGFPEEDPLIRAGLSGYFINRLIQISCRLTDSFFHDAKCQPKDKLDVINPHRETRLTKTKVDTLRLDAETVERCVKTCRKHQTSFTRLLHTLIKVILATDFYPKAKFSHSHLAVDIRSYLLPAPRVTMKTAVSIFTKFDWLAKFRKAGKGERDSSDKISIVNASIVWDLAREHKSLLMEDLNHTKIWRKAWKSMELVQADDEDFIAQAIDGYSTALRKSFEISNHGVFDPAQFGWTGSDAKWKISNMESSASIMKAGYGTNMTFNVIGVAGVDTVIHVGSEEGSLKDNFVASVGACSNTA